MELDKLVQGEWLSFAYHQGSRQGHRRTVRFLQLEQSGSGPLMYCKEIIKDKVHKRKYKPSSTEDTYYHHVKGTEPPFDPMTEREPP